MLVSRIAAGKAPRVDEVRPPMRSEIADGIRWLFGAHATAWGVTAPFWFAFVGSASILVAIWRELGNIAHADASSSPEDDQPATAPM